MTDIQQANLAIISGDQSAPATADQIKAQVNLIQEVMQSVMKPDVHFGKIPGTQKPTLLKPGAEKILSTFRVSVDPVVEDLSTPDEIRIRVVCRLLSSSGIFLGAGVGECSTSEEKYKWRAPIVPEEYEDTPPDRKRIKYKKGWDGKPNERITQVRTNPADLANTILKMAKKRALVDATLTITAASDIFDQDLDEMDPAPGYAKPAGRPAPAPNRKPANNKSGSGASDYQPLTDAMISQVNTKRKDVGLSDEDLDKYVGAIPNQPASFRDWTKAPRSRINDIFKYIEDIKAAN